MEQFKASLVSEGLQRNGYFMTFEAMEKALKSLNGQPIVALTGNWMYPEVPVGFVRESYIEEYDGKKQIVIEGNLWAESKNLNVNPSFVIEDSEEDEDGNLIIKACRLLEVSIGEQK